MNRAEGEKVVYLSDKQKKKKKRRLRYLNIGLVLVAVYFCFSIVRQEVALRKIQAETKQLSGIYQELTDAEKLLDAKLQDVNSKDDIRTQAKDTLGWVGEDEVKLVDKNNQ